MRDDVIFADFSNESSSQVALDEFVVGAVLYLGQEFHVEAAVVQELFKVENVCDVDLFAR